MMKKLFLLGSMLSFLWLILACTGTQETPAPPEEPVLELEAYLVDLLVVAQQEVMYKVMPYAIESAAHVTHILPKETLVLDKTYTDVTLIGIAIHVVINAAENTCKTFEQDLILDEESVVYQASRFRSEACLGEAFLDQTIYEENTIQLPGQPMMVVPYHRFPILGLIESTQAESTRIAAPLSEALLESATVLWQTHDEVVYGIFPNQETVHVTALTEIGKHLSHVTFLSTVNEYPVESMAASLFKDSEAIRTVTLPKCLTVIPADTFRNAQYLTDITIPAQVHTIGARAFSRTNALDQVTFASGNALKRLEKEAFGWSNVREIHLPNTLDYVGEHAFFGSRDLIIYTDHLSVPTTWHTHWNPNNQTVVLGYITTVDNGVIRYATSHNDTATILGLSLDAGFVELEIPEAIDHYAVIDIANAAFKDEHRLLSVHIPKTIQRITHNTFEGTENMTAVVLAENSQLESIGHAAFRRSAVQAIHIPAGVTVIEPWAFGEAAALETVSFAENSQLEIIAHRAFSNSAVQTLHLPALVREIGSSAFSMTTALRTVTFEAGSTLEIIEPHAFAYSSIESIELPASLTHILIGAFANTAELETVSFERGSVLETIGSHAFMMSAVTRIDIPLSVTTIGEMAFFGADQLSIYTEHEAEPSGWHATWNVSSRPVVWGYSID